jgi:hypothetical protein
VATIKKMGGSVAVVKTGPKLMPGSTDGEYFPFARKGNVLLGIRMQSIEPGEKYSVADTTYFSGRLRSAPENGLFAEEDAAKKVVKLQQNPPNVWDAWPGVTWEKANPERASTTVGVFIKGKFKGPKSELEKLVSNITDGKLASDMTSYLVELAGEANLIEDPPAIAGWLNGQIEPVIKAIIGQTEKNEVVTHELNSSVGNFGMQAAILKKVYADQPPGETGAAEDLPEDPGEEAELDEDGMPLGHDAGDDGSNDGEYDGEHGEENGD